MNLSQCHIIPGTVITVDDPMRGIIKCTAPGLFSVDDDPELLPPIRPFVQTHEGSISSISEGDQVWVLKDDRNSQMLYWIRRYVIPDTLRDVSPDREVVFCRDTDNGVYQLYWSSGEGVKLLAGGGSVYIDNDGNVNIQKEGPNRAISISDDSICLGKDITSAPNIYTHAAYGEKVEDALSTIYTILENISRVSTSNPYTSNLVGAIEPMLPILDLKISGCTSKDVKIV